MTETAHEGTNSGGTDVVTILTEDHREMLELLGRAETTLDAEERRIPNCSTRPSDRGSAWWTDCATH